MHPNSAVSKRCKKNTGKCSKSTMLQFKQGFVADSTNTETCTNTKMKNKPTMIGVKKPTTHCILMCIIAIQIQDVEPKPCSKKNLHLADSFLLFLQESKLHRFWFDDTQSSFVRYLTNDLIFSCMPEDAFYIFCFDLGNIKIENPIVSEQRGTKTLVVMKTRND